MNNARVRITKRKKRMFGEPRYEIEPLNYRGPWNLREGTILEVVAEPCRGTAATKGPSNNRPGDETEDVGIG